MIFLEEMVNESAARMLLDLSRNKRPSGYSMIGVARGKLFCLVVARSFVAGVGPIETPESLYRFSNGIGEVLDRYVRKL